MGNHLTVQWIHGMASRTQGYIGTDHNFVTNKDLAVVYQYQIEIGVEILTNMNVVTIGHMYRRLKEEPFTTASQNALHD